MDYINGGCYADLQRHRCLNPQIPPRISPDPQWLRSKQQRLEERLQLYQSIRQNWGTEQFEDATELFSKANEGIIGFQKISAKGGAIEYISDALEALVISEEKVTVKSIRVDTTNKGFVAEFQGEELTLHVQSIDDKTYIVHGYGKKLTEAAQRRVNGLQHPTVHVPFHLLLEHALFEKLSPTIGVQYTTPQELYQGGVGILKTNDPQQLKTAIEMFGKKYGVESIHYEIKEGTKVVKINSGLGRMHIEYANNQFFVCAYEQSPTLNPIQQDVVRSLPCIEAREPIEHTVMVYVNYTAPGIVKNSPVPYSIEIKTRRPAKVRVNTKPVIRTFETIEQICAHISSTIPTEASGLFMEPCTVRLGFSTYDMKKRFSKCDTERIHEAYATALSKAIVSGIQRKFPEAKTAKNTSGLDAGDIWFDNNIKPPSEAPNREYLTRLRIFLDQRTQSPTQQYDDKRDDEKPKGGKKNPH